MTKSEWFANVKVNENILKNIVARFHPYQPTKSIDDFPITAPNAEAACQIMREQIAKETVFDPLLLWTGAIQNEDCETIYSLLSSTWLGVPESTSCWEIEGFNELVDLLDEPFEIEENYA